MEEASRCGRSSRPYVCLIDRRTDGRMLFSCIDALLLVRSLHSLSCHPPLHSLHLDNLKANSFPGDTCRLIRSPCYDGVAPRGRNCRPPAGQAKR